MKKSLAFAIILLVNQFTISAEEINWKLEKSLTWQEIGVNKQMSAPNTPPSKEAEPEILQKIEQAKTYFHISPKNIYTQPRITFYRRHTEYTYRFCK